MKPRLIIGDIHGSALQLEVLLENCFVDHRPVIFLGDYVNRGRQSKQVVELMVQLNYRRGNLTFLVGNHDWVFSEYLASNISFEALASIGGVETLASYLPRDFRGNPRALLMEHMPSKHIEFFSRLEVYSEDNDLLCSHAGISPRFPEDRSLVNMALSSHSELFVSGYAPSKLVICGHYVQRDRIPFRSDRVYCLDTGCGTLPDGRLTALYLPESVGLQVDSLGRIERFAV